MPTASRSSRNHPWPAPTPTPAGSSSSIPKRRRSRTASPRRLDLSSSSEFEVRDDIVDEPQIQRAMNQCEVFSGNSVLSCWPPANGTSVAQHQFATFVWNSRLPQYAQTNLVNIYLFSGTSQQLLLSFPNQTNPDGRAGLIHAQVNDTWFGNRGDNWDGSNQTFLYYWVITRNTDPLDNRIVPQPLFTAVQTTFADSVVASMTSAAAASSASAASASAASAASASLSRASESAASLSTLTQNGGLSGTHTSVTPGASSSSSGGNVQSANGGSSFPHWAIAVITVLGFFALLAAGILFFVILRCMRRRKGANLSHRGSMGSSTPMMANAEQGGAPTSPVIGAGVYNAVDRHRPPSPEVQDGASTMSRGSDAGLFSGADAAVMANAFRAALRKPNFADRPDEEGESPDSNARNQEPDLLNAALNEEGRDIRSVGSSRGVRVETLSDAADNDTIQDHPH